MSARLQVYSNHVGILLRRPCGFIILSMLLGLTLTSGAVQAEQSSVTSPISMQASQLLEPGVMQNGSDPSRSEKLNKFVDGLNLRMADVLKTSPAIIKNDDVNLPGDVQPIVCNDEIAKVPASVLHDLNLTQAIDIAVCRNPQVKAAWALIKVQAAALGEARAAYYPNLSVSKGIVNDLTTYPGTNFPSTSLQSQTLYGTLSWRLWDAGARAAAERSANAYLSAALAGHDAQLQKTINTVIGAYYETQTARANWQAKTKAEQLAQLTVDASERRQHLGAGALTDTLQASTALAKASLEKERSFGAYRKSMSVLAYNLGLTLAYSPEITEEIGLAEDDNPLPTQTDALQRHLSSWLDQAENQHPSIVMARAKLVAVEEKAKSTAAEGLPSLDLTGNYYQNGRPGQGVTPATHERIVQLAITVPLFEGFSRNYKMRGAQAQIEKSEADLKDAQLQVSMEVVKAYADCMSALNNLTASQHLLDAAEKALSSVQRKYDRGAADILEILSTQNALSDAQLERVRCLAEWRSARLRLVSSAGGFGINQLAK